jgi:DNA-binding Xre family transcriptional regulator
MAIELFVHLADICQALRCDETDLLDHENYEKLSFNFISSR